MTERSQTRVGLLAGLWLVLGLVTVTESMFLVVRTDLGFVLSPDNTVTDSVAARVLQRGFAESPLLLMIEGPDRGRLSTLSDRMVESLIASNQFRYVFNGTAALPEKAVAAVFDWRYLLNPGLSPDYFSAPELSMWIGRRLENLAGVEGMATRSTLPADPTGRFNDVAATWLELMGRPPSGRWFSSDTGAALVVAGPKLSIDTLSGANAVLEIARAAFAEANPEADETLAFSGPMAFTVDAARIVRQNVIWLSIASVSMLILIIILAYRSLLVVAVITLPAGFGVAAGAAAVQILDGEVHGVTLAFGAVILGIALDYPMHMISHSGTAEALRGSTARVWRTVLLGAATTAAAFIPIVASQFSGLSQLGIFVVVGVTVAGLFSRWLLPAILPNYRAPDPRRLWQYKNPLQSAPARYGILMALIAGAVLWIAVQPTPWQNNLLALGPTPADRLELDTRLRGDLGADDLRYVFAVRGDSPEEVLQALEQQHSALGALGATGFASAARYLPSILSQKQTQSVLPTSDTLREALAGALVDLPIRPGTLEPFVFDVENSKSRTPILPSDLENADLGWVLDPLLFQDEFGWVGLVIPRGVIDARQLSEIAAAQDDLAFIDLRAASENIVVAFRSEAMQWMLIGSGVALALLFGALRNAVAVARTALPVVASITATVAVLLAAGETLSLFHLLALLLIGGLAIDYGLVLGLHAQTADDWRQSLRGVTFSAMTSFVPFALLGFSGVPVLHQIGLTVAVGIVFSLAFAQFLNNGNFQWQTA